MPLDPVSKFFSLRIIWLLLAVSVGINMWLVYRLFDTSLSLDHSRRNAGWLRERADDSLKLVQYMLVDTPTTDLEKIADEFSHRGEIVKRAPGRLEINDVVFLLSDGKIASVEYLDQ